MADAIKNARVFSSAYAAALAFLSLAKIFRAQQPSILRELLKGTKNDEGFTFDVFEKMVRDVASHVWQSRQEGYDPQLIDRVPGRQIFRWRPRVSVIRINFEKFSVTVDGMDDESAELVRRLEELNNDGLEMREIPPPEDRQLRLF